ncbi:hypothetical protein D3OALGA1CA_3816 [Olavius algarvensis associated proteobacterium Delta 3]|nr:hypothetical protein D3OALGA1CA_3816 [Olavius algarvensis associated proteobacterium Delta 3]CAB5150483.1 hypothetical protein D3OALGB2SA_4774 [Olavius algarvensis associated proteobacterium Delta 3]
MDELLDIVWFKILAGVQYGKELLDILFSPLNLLGPAMAILLIAAVTVVCTRFLTKNIKTRRYRELQKEFLHWYNLRQEALNCEDPDKGKLLAKNIDQGKLNRVYYDYFFEGLMLSFLTKYIPILTVLAYVNEAYRRENLMALFGRDYIFRYGGNNGDPVLVGSVFWFVLSILIVYLAWSGLSKMIRRYLPNQKPPVASLPSAPA